MYNVNAMRNDAVGGNILKAFFRPLGIVKEIFCFCGFFRNDVTKYAIQVYEPFILV